MSDILHASAVSLDGRGCLILGPSGAGKSSLALQLISLGASLIADDRTLVSDDTPPTLSAPDAIAGRIEARGMGLIRLPHTSAPLALVVDLAQVETTRLPEPREIVISGYTVPRLLRVETPAFPAMVHACLRGDLERP